jgi:hypothetical protein
MKETPRRIMVISSLIEISTEQLEVGTQGVGGGGEGVTPPALAPFCRLLDISFETT